MLYVEAKMMHTYIFFLFIAASLCYIQLYITMLQIFVTNYIVHVV